MATTVTPRRGRYQYADAPHPKDGETNPHIERTVALPGQANDDGTPRMRTELAPLPETWPGGFYRTADGRLVDARGVDLTVHEHAKEYTAGELVQELARLSGGSDLHPAVQQAIARERAAEREAADRATRGIVNDADDKGKTPPERAEDVRARERHRQRRDDGRPLAEPLDT